MDVGTVSWTLLVCIYFLSLHIGVSASNEMRESSADSKVCIDFNSIIDMLEVLKLEFGNLLPLQSDEAALRAQSPGAIVQLKDYSMIKEVNISSNPLDW